MAEDNPLVRWFIGPILVGCLVFWAVEHPLHGVFPPLIATIITSPVAEVIVAVSIALAWPLVEAAFGRWPGLIFLSVCIVLGVVIGSLVVVFTGLGTVIFSSDYIGGGIAGMIVGIVICAHYALLRFLIGKMVRSVEDDYAEYDDDDFGDDEGEPGSYGSWMGKAMAVGATKLVGYLILIIGYSLAMSVLTLSSAAVAHFAFGKGILISVVLGLGCSLLIVGLLTGLSFIIERTVEPVDPNPYGM